MLHLTPAMLEQAYSYLLTTPPFNKWKLPAVDDVEFILISGSDRWGRCGTSRDGTPYIQIDMANSKTSMLIETMAHEVIHLHLHQTDKRTHHGPRFKRCAQMVCRKHGFDPNTF